MREGKNERYLIEVYDRHLQSGVADLSICPLCTKGMEQTNLWNDRLAD